MAGKYESLDSDRLAEVILSGPVGIFILIAAADGEIDNKEVMSFINSVGEIGGKQQVPSQIRAIFKALPNSVKNLIDEYTPKQETPEKLYDLVLESSECVKETYSEEIAQRFNGILVELATNIAKASGGFFGLGSKIDRSEKKVIEQLKSMLRVK
ncbi:MAG: hypothetical protein MK132_18580 [Lentisphaerales bacterium]|nr:hypothetical protein [Lentisphaerales bacterium]